MTKETTFLGEDVSESTNKGPVARYYELHGTTARLADDFNDQTNHDYWPEPEERSPRKWVASAGRRGRKKG